MNGIDKNQIKTLLDDILCEFEKKMANANALKSGDMDPLDTLKRAACIQQLADIYTRWIVDNT
jgi:hypothetical protein